MSDQPIAQPEQPRSFIQILKDFAWIIIPIIVVCLLAAIFLYRFVDPAPPRELTIATGSKDQTYFQVGKGLAQALEQEGIKLKVLPTSGSVENLELLYGQDSGVDLAFVQSGVESLVAPPENARELNSLGSCFYEPFWLFHDSSLTVDKLTDLRSQGIAVGDQGSGALAVSLALLQENGLAPENWQQTTLPSDEYPLFLLGGKQAADAVLNGELAAAFFVTSPRSPLIKRLLASPKIKLFEPRRADAYLKRFNYLSKHILHEGVLDLENNLPTTDSELLATTAMLVAPQDLHPAIIPLILKELRRVLDRPAVIGGAEDFPSARFSSIELNEDAERFYEKGPPFLQRFMPFWAAALIERYIFMALPLITILIPLLRVAGPAYRWRIRSRIYKWYRDLREVDARSSTDDLATETHTQDIRKLDELSEELSKINVPLSYADSLYDLQLHVDLLRRRLAEKSGELTSPESEQPSIKVKSNSSN